MQKRLIEINEELAQIETRSAEIHTADRKSTRLNSSHSV